MLGRVGILPDRISPGGSESAVSFDDWVGGRSINSFGTNAGATALPFQGWRHFKEAFAPELVRRAILESPVPVHRCADPFGGSGTTALACQFLGVRPVTIEVNPYLAGLIEAKLATYEIGTLARDFAALVKAANRKNMNPSKFFATAPATFVEPGVDGRWIFDTSLARRLAAYVASLPTLTNLVNQRLLRVLLGGVLIGLSNVVVSGKGRRYRGSWEQRRRRTAADLDEALCTAIENAVDDIVRYDHRAERRSTVLRGDARSVLRKIKPIDLAVFSPPYPNSFDYTDVYNVELWALGYLDGPAANTRLRLSTLASHVQIKRFFAPAPQGSALLKKILRALQSVRAELWDGNIPNMVGAYFADMVQIVTLVAKRLPTAGQAWMVVGDSGYAGVRIPVAEILAELAAGTGCRVVAKEPFRSMRASAQQGGSSSLAETLVVLSRR